MTDEAEYLTYIAESIRLVDQYITGQDGRPSEQAFLEDVRTQDAVIRRLETLADAASELSDELKLRHPILPWRQINDFRNVLAHGYLDLQVSRIWRTIVVDLPALKAAVHDELGDQT